jgi:hypothetical protein
MQLFIGIEKKESGSEWGECKNGQLLQAKWQWPQPMFLEVNIKMKIQDKMSSHLFSM